MRRFLAPSMLLLLAACGPPEPPAWDAWLAPGTVEVELVSSEPEGSLTLSIDVSRDGDSRVVRLSIPDHEVAQRPTDQSLGPDFALLVADTLHARALRVHDANPSDLEIEDIDWSRLHGRGGHERPPEILESPEVQAWQKAEAVRWWNALGIPWLASAERGEYQATLTLPVVGRDVKTRLVLGALEHATDGTVLSNAAYWWRGTDARDLSAVFLRQLRERGEDVAASHMEIDIQGVFWTAYDASTRRPVSCRHSWSTTYGDPSSGTEMTTNSTNMWIFHWPEDADTEEQR